MGKTNKIGITNKQKLFINDYLKPWFKFMNSKARKSPGIPTKHMLEVDEKSQTFIGLDIFWEKGKGKYLEICLFYGSYKKLKFKKVTTEKQYDEILNACTEEEDINIMLKKEWDYIKTYDEIINIFDKKIIEIKNRG